MAEVGRMPPQNLEAEQSVLGSLLIDKDAIIKIADSLNSHEFYKDAHGMIYEAMVDLYASKEPIDLLSLSSKLEEKKQLEKIGGRAYLTSLTNVVPTAANVVHYAGIVRKKAILRKLISTAADIGQLGYKEEEEAAKLLDEAESRLFGISQGFLKPEFASIKSLLTEAFDRIDELHREKGKLRGIPTGFGDLDKKLAGLQKSDLIILAARPSVGKTSLALDIARQVAVKQKAGVGIFSLEMSKEQLIDRMICAQAGTSLWKLRTGNLSDRDVPGQESDFSRIGHAMGSLSEARIFIDDTPMTNVMEVRTKARRLHAEHNLGLIVLDYLQLMEGGQGSNPDNRVNVVSEISRGLKAIARELNVPLLALSQLSRQVEQRPRSIPRLADLRESGCLAGETEIFDVNKGEFRTIKELAGEGRPFSVLSIDSKLKIKTARAKKAFYSGKKNIYELLTASGRSIKASGNHPFRKLYNWERLDKLKVGDRIAVPKKYGDLSSKVRISDNRLIILAHLMGDGCYSKGQPLHYTSADMKSIKEVKKTAEKEFSIKAKIVPQKSWFHLYMSGKDKSDKKRNIILKWLDELGIFNQRSGEKIVPRDIFKLDNKKIALFIRHLWSTDGCIFRAGQSNYKIYYASKNRKLIKQLQHLLLRFGILGTIRVSRKKGYGEMYQLDISGKNDQLLFLKQIGIFGQKEELVKKAIVELDQIPANPNLDVIPKEIWQEIEKLRVQAKISTREFHKKIGWAYSGTQRHKNGISRDRLKKILKVINNQLLTNLLSEDIYWDSVKAIKKMGKEDVYDIEVPKTHNFIANDIIVHNSIEQDADVVMFIYREEMYKKDTDRPHIADVMIQKHRNGPTGNVSLFFDENAVSFKNLEQRVEELEY